jgi:SecD/SecF fusion protein
MRRSSVKEIINTSLWETVRRSVATTIIVLLPVSALMLFGGETLQDFAFAILIGISISAFSTIFIAAPFLAVLLEHDPELKRRSAEPGAAIKEARVRVPAAGRADGDGDGDGGQPVAAPTPTPAAPSPAGAAGKREARRQRRRARPHGRAR